MRGVRDREFEKALDQAIADDLRQEYEAKKAFARSPGDTLPYVVVRQPTLLSLEVEVARLMGLGYIPQGGVKVQYRRMGSRFEGPWRPEGWYLQAMVRTE